METNVTRACFRLMTVVIAATLWSNPARGQEADVAPFLAIGLLAQDSPQSVEAGYAVQTGMRVRLTRWLAALPGLEFVRAHGIASNDVCFFLPRSNTCRSRADNESLIGISAALELHIPHPSALRPHLALGAAWMHSLAGTNPGESRRFLAPHVSLGLAWGRGRQEWSFDVRLRRLDRWRDSAHGQAAVLLGFTR